MFVALFDATVNQILFWTTTEYHTQAIATRIGNGALLASFEKAQDWADETIGFNTEWWVAKLESPQKENA